MSELSQFQSDCFVSSLIVLSPCTDEMVILHYLLHHLHPLHHHIGFPLHYLAYCCHL